MSEARKCDRCHGYFELSEEDHKNRNYPYDMKGTYVKIMLFGRYGEVENSVRWFDLCPNCMESLDKWLENPKSSNEYGCPCNKCVDCRHFTSEPNPFNSNDHKGVYICNLKKVYISGNCSRPNVSDMTPADFCKLGCNFVKENTEEPDYKDPCKSCHNGVCEQCDYGYISEEEKKKRWVERHKTETELHCCFDNCKFCSSLIYETISGEEGIAAVRCARKHKKLELRGANPNIIEAITPETFDEIEDPELSDPYEDGGL